MAPPMDGLTLMNFMPGYSDEGKRDEADMVAIAGTPLPAGAPQATDEEIVDALKSVHDPEIPVNIYDLGLIYRLHVADDGNVSIDMTLTAPACPVAGQLPQQVAEAVAAVDGVGEVDVRLVWDPPWTQDRMSETAQLMLGLY
ncbi:MAG: SUF system Fe-S cluster assembly protein [Rhodospirillales bacterium]|jgi:FeS assembly SUF system protein|nr:SUF system Fe-S cluster assembly protein [Rhodospirillales bacterium]